MMYSNIKEFYLFKYVVIPIIIKKKNFYLFKYVVIGATSSDKINNKNEK